nr:unnamed protein product [Callosobruchus chinensis]
MASGMLHWAQNNIQPHHRENYNNKLLAAPGHPDYNLCARFEMLVTHDKTVFAQHYVPHQQLSIDESLVGTHCHSSLKQYLPNKKRHKWSIKFWMLCDSITKYCLGFFCYKGGKNAEGRDLIKKDGLGFSVVEKLLSVGNYLQNVIIYLLTTFIQAYI